MQENPTIIEDKLIIGNWSYTEAEIKLAFEEIKRMKTGKMNIDRLAGNILVLVENIIDFKKNQTSSENKIIGNKSLEENNYVNIINEFKILKKIIDNLLSLHDLYIEEIKAGNNNIINDTDHTNCEFAIYLESVENSIKSDYIKDIIDLIKDIHETFHNDIKKFFNNKGNNIEFSNYLDNSLNFLSNILTIVNSIENSILIDKKTGLYNLDKLKQDIETFGISQLFLIKINNFSKINSLLGYEIGDKVLLEIIKHINENLKLLDCTIYRTGQLEFGVISHTKDENYGKDFINKNINFDLKLTEPDIDLPINLSIGGANSNEDLYDKALEALYESKKTGKYTFYSKELDDEIKKKIQNNIFRIKEVKDAIKNGNIKAYFQGIRNNKTGEITKYESLVRIEKDGKVFTPGDFLIPAKERGLIGQITRIMIEENINMIIKTGKFFSVNLTEDDLNDIDLINFIENTINKTGIDASHLIIEVLENITQVDCFLENIARLRKLGIEISIDDFGSGYSNHQRMAKLKPDYLKIDGTLIKGIANNKELWYIVRSIVDLAHINGYKVIAEFVDNKEDQAIIEDLRIDYSQGYLYSKPSRDI